MHILLMAPPQGGGTIGTLVSFLPLVLIFIVFYFFMMRPQMKKQKEQEAFKSTLQKGDMIITIGGIHGKIADMRENQTYLLLEIESGQKMRIERSSVSSEATQAAYPKKA